MPNEPVNDLQRNDLVRNDLLPNDLLLRALLREPTPRTPVRIHACGMRPVSNAFETVRTIASCPIRSSKVAGRYLRASTR